MMMGTLASASRTARSIAAFLAASIERSFPEHIPVYVCSIFFGLCTFAIADIFHAPIDLDASAFFLAMGGKCLTIGGMIVAAIELIKLMRGGFPDRPARILGGRLLRWFSLGERPGNLFHALVAFALLAVSFTTLKEAIPQINPFDWDQTFMQWDRIIGLGHQPWEILQPILGYAPITMALNFAYDCWFLVMFGCFFWQAFAATGSALRIQFLLAFAFAWFIGGNLIAAALSSAGPCFYGHLYPLHNPYAAQMAYLQAVNQNWPILSVDVQQTLWRSYAAGHGTLGGISAMPSMHVTIAVLIAIWGWRVHRAAGLALGAFAFVIFLGSIHLTWHYAVDGIAGGGLAALFWIAAGVIARAYERYRTPHSRAAQGAMSSASRA
jgi:hypothetical protein